MEHPFGGVGAGIVELACSPPARRLVSSKALEKIRDLLSRRIQTSGFSLRKLERQLGFATGSLSKMLRGLRKLEVGELLILLATLDLQAGPFFAEVAGELSLPAGIEPEQEPAT